MKKTFVYIFAGIFIAWVVGIIGYKFLGSDHFITYLNWAQSNIILFITTLIFIKSVTVIFPPLPSVIMSFSAIPVFGWFNAYLIDYVGSILGSSLSYFLAYKYGVPLLSKILDKNTVNKLNKIKIKKGKEVEGVIVLRILTSATLVEAINYGAGLIKIPYSKFLIGFLISHPIVGIPMFYFVNNIIQQKSVFMTMILSVGGIFIVYLLKNRYFEKNRIKPTLTRLQ